MMIVIILIGLLAGIAASRLDWGRYRAEAVARGALASISTAQRTAVSLQTDVRLIPVGTNRLQIHEDANNNGSIDGSERVTYLVLDHGYQFGQGSIAAVPAPADATDLSAMTVIFRRDGSASRGGTYYISSPAYDPDCKYCRGIALTRATGRAVSYSRATGAWVRGN